ncbi:MAG: histidine kinase dimerization/phosphoacceptor domain-containing protein [Verrucomicrobia bacterium]|nr:histidine kinase dimerization/phosphoacceptor domain-containing protein [Verrucomicrobiota bacterium]
MSLTEESQLICRGLDEFCLPAALISVRSDRAVQWNASFLAAIGCTPAEMRIVPISELVQLDPGSDSHCWHCDHVPVPIHLEPCLVRNSQTRTISPGRSFRRDNDFAFVMLDPVSLDTEKGNFQTGRAMGEQQERERLRALLHRGVSQHLVAMSFGLARCQNLLAEGTPITAEDLERVVRLVDESTAALRELMHSGPRDPVG